MCPKPAKSRSSQKIQSPQREDKARAGKVALVTGANRGLGLAIASALAGQGCHLAITGRDEKQLQHASRELTPIAGRVLAYRCDVRDRDSVRDLMKTVRKNFGRIDILVNNAGVAHRHRPIATLPPEWWDEVLETNLGGLFTVTQEALKLMHGGGVIVNNLSIAARRVFAGSAAYITSKHGALGFTNALREELREKGIRVIALIPGATDTEIWQTLWPEAPRRKMMAAATVAQALVSALALPEDGTMEELTVLPRSGTL